MKNVFIKKDKLNDAWHSVRGSVCGLAVGCFAAGAGIISTLYSGFECVLEAAAKSNPAFIESLGLTANGQSLPTVAASFIVLAVGAAYGDYANGAVNAEMGKRFCGTGLFEMGRRPMSQLTARPLGSLIYSASTSGFCAALPVLNKIGAIKLTSPLGQFIGHSFGYIAAATGLIALGSIWKMRRNLRTTKTLG